MIDYKINLQKRNITNPVFIKLFAQFDDSIANDPIILKEHDEIINDLKYSQNDDELIQALLDLNNYLKSNDYETFPNLKESEVIQIILNTLNRNDDLDICKLNAAKCIQNLCFKMKDFTIFFGTKPDTYTGIYRIFQAPLSPVSQHALEILINIFSDFPEFIPRLLEFFQPKLILNMFKNSSYGVGVGRNILYALKLKITIPVSQLFMQYCTTQLSKENFTIILAFFHEMITMNDEYTVLDIKDINLNGLVGIYQLFSTNHVDMNYLCNVPYIVTILLPKFINENERCVHFFNAITFLINKGGIFPMEKLDDIKWLLTDMSSNLYSKQCIFNLLYEIYNQNPEFQLVQEFIDIISNYIEYGSFEEIVAASKLYLLFIQDFKDEKLLLLLEEKFINPLNKIALIDDEDFNENLLSFLKRIQYNFEISSFPYKFDEFLKKIRANLFDSFDNKLFN